MCDVALDPYTNHGHDGVLKNNYVDNETVINITEFIRNSKRGIIR